MSKREVLKRIKKRLDVLYSKEKAEFAYLEINKLISQIKPPKKQKVRFSKEDSILITSKILISLSLKPKVSKSATVISLSSHPNFLNP